MYSPCCKHPPRQITKKAPIIGGKFLENPLIIIGSFGRKIAIFKFGKLAEKLWAFEYFMFEWIYGLFNKQISLIPSTIYKQYSSISYQFFIFFFIYLSIYFYFFLTDRLNFFSRVDMRTILFNSGALYQIGSHNPLN